MDLEAVEACYFAAKKQKILTSAGIEPATSGSLTLRPKFLLENDCLILNSEYLETG